MPIIQPPKRINPLDLNKNVTIGVAFPLDEENMFSGTETMGEQINANLLNLLLTYPEERVNLPQYGIGIKNLLFEQNLDLEQLKEKIQNQKVCCRENQKKDCNKKKRLQNSSNKLTRKTC